jgi:uncharacterized protein YjhX (UPF0386 family)
MCAKKYMAQTKILTRKQAHYLTANFDLSALFQGLRVQKEIKSQLGHPIFVKSRICFYLYASVTYAWSM